MLSSNYMLVAGWGPSFRESAQRTDRRAHEACLLAFLDTLIYFMIFLFHGEVHVDHIGTWHSRTYYRWSFVYILHFVWAFRSGSIFQRLTCLHCWRVAMHPRPQRCQKRPLAADLTCEICETLHLRTVFENPTFVFWQYIHVTLLYMCIHTYMYVTVCIYIYI